MRVPRRLEPLLDQGVVQDVIRPLLAGKEAEIYLVVSRGEECVAKVYKEATNRSFKHRAMYTEGRRVRNSRRQRAMAKRSKHGRKEVEAAWRHAEVDAIYRLQAAGVRVPQPYDYIDGVLIMELVRGEDGLPAPRLADLSFRPDHAREVFDELLREVVKMLCAGVVHGDLSDFNVLMGPDGPVIIDFPQWVDPAHNRNARKLLLRDVDNLQSFLGRYERSLRKRRYGKEMWDLYEHNELRPHTELTGRFQPRKRKEDPLALLHEIEELERIARERRERLGLPMRPARAPMPAKEPPREAPKADDPPKKKKKRRRRKRKRKGRGSAPRAEASGRPPQAPKKGSDDDVFADLDALLSVEGDDQG